MDPDRPMRVDGGLEDGQYPRQCGSGVPQGRHIMVRKIVTIALIASGLTMAACNTVRGAARDVNSVANCTQNTVNGRNC